MIRADANSGAFGGETRIRLIQAAVSSFAVRGYASTSLNEVVERAGLTTGAIYSNFDSKEDLFVSAADFVYARIERAVTLGERPEYSLEERVSAFIDSIVQLADSEPETLAFQAVVAVEVRRFPELRAAIGDEFQRRLDFCRRVVGLVGDTGLGVTVDELAGVMVLAAEGLTASATGQVPSPLPPDQREAELWKQLIFRRLLVTSP